MQTSLDTYAAAWTRENRDAEISDFKGSTGSASVKHQNPFSSFRSCESTRQEQARPCVDKVSEAAGPGVSTASAAAEPFVEADILSSTTQLPAGTLFILPENVPQFRKRLARIDRSMKVAQASVASMRKKFFTESDCDDASSSEDKAEQNPLDRYIEKNIIIQWNLTEPSIAKFSNQFGDEASVNWSVRELRSS